MSAGPQPTAPGYVVGLLEQSGLAETLVLSTSLLENQPSVYRQVLQTLQKLTGSSGKYELSATRMENNKAIKQINSLVRLSSS